MKEEDAETAERSQTEPRIVFTHEPDALAALRAGARGVLPPGAAPEIVRIAEEAVARGLIVIAPELLALPEPAFESEPAFEPAPETDETEPALTPRERAVLTLLAEGVSNKIIARRLGISFHTVKFHVAAILTKLNARTRTDAVAQGVRLGLVLL